MAIRTLKIIIGIALTLSAMYWVWSGDHKPFLMLCIALCGAFYIWVFVEEVEVPEKTDLEKEVEKKRSKFQQRLEEAMKAAQKAKSNN